MRGWPATRRRRPSPGIAVLAAGLAAAAIALAADVGDVLSAQEQDTVALRYQLRGEQPVDGITLVAIDDASISHMGVQWPFRRSLHARAVDRLRRAGARVIVYDVQFTEQTRPREDLALFDAVARAPRIVLATSETRGPGEHEILGGPENLAETGATAAAANLTTEPGDVLQRFRSRELGLPTLAVAGAALAGGGRLPASRYPERGAWIDFRGPPGTIPSIPFEQVLAGKFDPAMVRDRIVVVGATAPTLHDVHPTPTSDTELMSGPEVQANAIWTALHGLPLRERARLGRAGSPSSLMGLGPALATVRGRAMRAVIAAPLLAAGWLATVQLGFQAGRDPAGQLPADRARCSAPRRARRARSCCEREAAAPRARSTPARLEEEVSRAHRGAAPDPARDRLAAGPRRRVARRRHRRARRPHGDRSASGSRWRSGCPTSRPS